MSFVPELAIDHLEHALEILVHVDVGNAHDAEAKRLEHPCPLRITSDLRRRTVRLSIDFDDQLAVERDEINGVSVNRVLAAKLAACKLATPQRLPEHRLGMRLC